VADIFVLSKTTPAPELKTIPADEIHPAFSFFSKEVLPKGQNLIPQSVPPSYADRTSLYPSRCGGWGWPVPNQFDTASKQLILSLPPFMTKQLAELPFLQTLLPHLTRM
jgi:hypothetical protein